jgi:O-antigen/teichoic acid export membrane protein
MELTATAIDTILTIVIGIAAMMTWGLVGLAYATLAGSVVATALQCGWYLKLIKRRKAC